MKSVLKNYSHYHDTEKVGTMKKPYQIKAHYLVRTMLDFFCQHAIINFMVVEWKMKILIWRWDGYGTHFVGENSG